MAAPTLETPTLKWTTDPKTLKLFDDLLRLIAQEDGQTAAHPVQSRLGMRMETQKVNITYQIGAQYTWDDAFFERHREEITAALGKEVDSISFPLDSWRHLHETLEESPNHPLGHAILYRVNDRYQATRGYSGNTTGIWRHKTLGFLVVTHGGSSMFVARSNREALLNWFESLDLSDKNPLDPYDGYVWTPETERVRRDLDFFLSRESWFETRRIPYARSYLFHGMPGCGKSSLIRCLGRRLGTSPETFDFSMHRQSPDGEFKQWIEAIKLIGGERSVRFLILEDLDHLYPKDGSKTTDVSLSCVLNALDGATERTHMILIASANHPEALDEQVLLRPGRFNLRVEFKAPTPEQAVNFLREMFKHDHISQTALEEVAERTSGHTYAFLKGLVADAASIAMTRGSEEIHDEDVLLATGAQLGTSITIRSAKKAKTGF